MDDGIKIISQNRKARFEYHILETWQAGLELKGSEVKSLRDGQVQLGDSFARFQDGELYLFDAHISEYKQANINNHDPLRKRKLLLRGQELRKIKKKSEQDHLTVIPLKLYFQRGWAKLEIGLAKGKKLHDKREDMKKKEDRREMRKFKG